MKGWKTWTGALIIGVSAALEVLGEEYAAYSQAIMMIGGALGLIGVGHKVEKQGGGS